MVNINNFTSNAYSFSFQGCDNTVIKLADFKGKVIMVVNTASFCGFTPQYRDLQELHEQYYEQGLRVIAVPSSDFRKQDVCRFTFRYKKVFIWGWKKAKTTT